MSQLEWLAAALVLINVALVAMRKVWNYPFALAAVTLYAFVFYEAKLYSDMLLQGFFFVLNLYGWLSWVRARDDSGVPVGWMPGRDRWRWGAAVGVAWVAWSSAMHRYTDAAAPRRRSARSDACMTRHIGLHGAESTGKSKLAPRLAARLGGVVIPEYGRTYCEANGTDLDAGDLLAIFHGHVAATKLALAQVPAWVISDTDPLMTQAWAIMLLGRRLPEIDAWSDVADFYLVPALDLPWREDGTRLFGSDLARRQFMDVAIAELDRRRLPWAWVEGDGDARLESALAAIAAAGPDR